MDRWASIPSRWLLSFKLDARCRFRAQTPWRRDAASLSLALTLTSLRRPRPSSTDRQHNDVTRTAKDDAISGVMHCRPRRRLRHHLRRCRRRWRPVGPSISPRFRLQSRDSLEFSASSRSTESPRGSFRRGSRNHVAASRYYLANDDTVNTTVDSLPSFECLPKNFKRACACHEDARVFMRATEPTTRQSVADHFPIRAVSRLLEMR